MSRSYIPQTLRETVAKQAQYRCGYCLTQEWIIGSPLEVEHIIPEAREGQTEEGNLWLACNQCNKIKSNRIEASVGIGWLASATGSRINIVMSSWTSHETL